jgi:hypothetical protein
MVTWESLRNIKKQYYPFRSYDDLYTKWTTLRQERDQAVPEFTNIFHTLHTKLVIKYYERHLVLKYHSFLHRYIQAEMEFLDISSLGVAYRYAVKIEQKLKQKMQKFGPGNPSHQKKVKGSLNLHKKVHRKDDNLGKTNLGHNQRRTLERQTKISGNGVTSIRALGITMLFSAPSNP